MRRFQRGLVVYAVLAASCTGFSLAQTTDCFPPCRSGFVCHNGTCVSVCNPPCPEGERCTPEGECVPKDAPATVPPAPEQATSPAPAYFPVQTPPPSVLQSTPEPATPQVPQREEVPAVSPTEQSSSSNEGIVGLYWLGGYHRYPSKGSEFMDLTESVGFTARDLNGFAWEIGITALAPSSKHENAGVGIDIFFTHTFGYSDGQPRQSNDTVYLPSGDELRMALFQGGFDISYGVLTEHFALQIPVGIGGCGAYRSLDGDKDDESMSAFLFRFGVRMTATAGRFGFITQFMYDLAKTEFENKLKQKYDFSTGGMRITGGILIDMSRM